MLGHRLGINTAAALAALAMGLAACGGDDSTGASTTDPPRTESPSTTLAPAEQAEAEVRAAYDAYWAMSERLAAAPDPNDPEIAERTTGGAKTTLTDHLTTLSALGTAVQFGAQYAHDVATVELDANGTSAIVSDCYVDDAREVDVRTGDVLRESTFTNRFDVTLRLESSAWKVAQIERLGSWEGVKPCE